MRSRFVLPVLLAVPGIGLAVVGLFHPHALNAQTANQWYLPHLPGIFFFPLVGVALAVLVWRRNDPLAWLVRVAAYVYATFYTALDAISGVGAGFVTREMVEREGDGYQRAPEISLLFRIGTPLGEVGSWALLLCAVALVVDQVGRHGVAGAPALVLVLGAYLVHIGHIFAPQGVAGMALIGLTTAYLAWLSRLGTAATATGEAVEAARV